MTKPLPLTIPSLTPPSYATASYVGGATACAAGTQMTAGNSVRAAIDAARDRRADSTSNSSSGRPADRRNRMLRTFSARRGRFWSFQTGVAGGLRALAVEHLPQGVLDLHEVRLVRHHLVDRLVGVRMLVEQLHRLVGVPRPVAHRRGE